MRDYLTMLNERDGGIGGVKLVLEECETGYDTKKGIECYEAVKSKNPVVMNPWSTGITLPLIPRAAVDKVPDSLDGLRFIGLGRRANVSLDFQSPSDILGRPLADHQSISARKRGASTS